MLRRIVWSSVVAAVLAVGSVWAAFAGWDTEAVSLGLASVTAAVLSGRER